MAQYAIDPTLLLPYLPAGLDLDLYENRCYVSLVAFLFDRVRLKGIPIPFHTRFEEVNLRFYVRRKEPDGSVKRGVVFLSRDSFPATPSPMSPGISTSEPYTAIPTNHHIDLYARIPQGRLHLGPRGTLPQPRSRSHTDPERNRFPTAKRTSSPNTIGAIPNAATGTTSARTGVEHPRWQIYQAPQLRNRRRLRPPLRPLLRLPDRPTGLQRPARGRLRRRRPLRQPSRLSA